MITKEITNEAEEALAKLAKKYLRRDQIFQVNIVYRKYQTIPEKTMTIVERKPEDSGFVKFSGLQNHVALWSFNKTKVLCEYDEYSGPLKFKFNARKAYEDKQKDYTASYTGPKSRSA